MSNLQSFFRKLIPKKFLPQIIIESLGYLQYRQLCKELAIKRNALIRNTRKESRCFILATGPSIKQQNLSVLKNEYTIAVNNFFLHSDFKTIAPKYYCMTPYHPEVGDKIWQEWIDEYDRSLQGLDTTLFFNLDDKDRLFRKPRFVNKKMYFVKFDALGQYNNDYDLSKPVLPVQSVSIMALYVALHLGFKEIYLLGCDHDWIFNYKRTQHFYPEDKSTLAKRGYSEWDASSDIGIEFRSLASLWDQYRKIRDHTLNKNIKIFYSTPNGSLDIFPSKNIEEIFPPW